MFWYKKVDQNSTPSVEKLPENSDHQVLTAFVIQRSGGIETSNGNPQDFKTWHSTWLRNF